MYASKRTEYFVICKNKNEFTVKNKIKITRLYSCHNEM